MKHSRLTSAALLAFALASTPAHAALEGPIGIGRDGHVEWSTFARPLPDSTRHAFARLEAAARTSTPRAESLAAFTSLRRDPLMRAWALKRLAPLELMRRDTTAADAAWAELAALPSIWTWEALRSRADLRAGDPVAAEAVLEPAARDGWPDVERAAWLVRRAALRAQLGDTAQAIDFARQTLRRYPNTAPAARALADLERWEAARGRATLAPEDEEAAAEVEVFRGRRGPAIDRLERAVARASGAGRAGAGLRLAELLRQDSRSAEAFAALARVERDVVADTGAAAGTRRARVAIERARLHRDAGRADSAFAHWRVAAASAADTSVLETALWEALREAEEAERGALVRELGERLAGLGGRRAAEGALRAGIQWLHSGDETRARSWFARAGGEGGAFWTAVAIRRRERARSDSILAALAARPGYGFYPTIARDTLRARGWPGRVALAPPDSLLDPAVALAERLALAGAVDDGLRVLERWQAGDPRLVAPAGDGARAPRWAQLLAAARVAYAPRDAGNRWASGIRFGRLAYDAVPDTAPELRWSVAPWMYPPAHHGLFAPGGAWTDSTALLYGVAWQESKFDPRARSRSDALGLVQLKFPTALEQARLMRIRLRSPGDLSDPRLNLRLGAGYLSRILRAYGGRLPIALAGYNAGPTAARKWLRRPDPGGEAMAVELIGYGQAHEYVKIILGIRQAARELRPGPARAD